MRKALIIASFIFSVSALHSQVNIHEEDIVTSAMDRYIEKNNEVDFIRGWKIQIITTDDRREMENAKYKFSRLFPHIDYKWEHTAPYYKVKIGAYEKKADLEAFLLLLKKDFPSAIPVHDNIRKADLINPNG